ncbi:MAG: phosphoglycolate phosphatase [Bacteroidetes bacterium RIFCSPLOWO2_12_FULL_35_15]|nr:MAG: phosphoglycolate phosphatase [Bacteroidetes bacterium RIFCSPLOWO2_12_FULL_35_15]
MTDKIENILFDLDGTLTNPKEGIVNSILYALNKMGIEENSPHELDSFIGPPLRESFQMRYNLSDKASEEIVVAYREYFSTKGLYENKLYDGITELLESLHAQKYKLFVATSKPTVYSEQILEHFKLKKYFTEIIGSNVDNTRTDKTEIIALVVSSHALQASKSIMVGDTKFDMIGAKNNAIKTIGVTYGYGSFEELSFHQPDFIVNTCGEIKSIINRGS